MAAGVQTVSNVERGLNFAIAREPLILIAMTDENRGGDPLEMIRRLPKNSVLIFRHYSDPAREQLARQVVRACRTAGAYCLVAGDISLARKSKSDGVHFPEHQLRRLPVRRFMPPRWITTGAAHNHRNVRRVEALGLDAALLSPIFASKSHPGVRALGIWNFAVISRRVGVPVIALGGVSTDRLRRLRLAGASGVAGISLFSRQ